MDDIIIIGAGGVGKETALLVEQINRFKPTWNILGFLDDNARLQYAHINGYKVLGEINHIRCFNGIYAICAVADYKAKRRIVEGVDRSKVKFANIIHPSVYVSSTNTLGEGVIIYPGVVMTSNIEVGNHVILSPGCGIGHEAVIEDFCSILWKVSVSGNVRIGKGCLLGSGSTVIQNVTIGKETTVGAGALVLEDLPQGCTAVGVPARIIKIRNALKIL